ncbi:MAG: glycosyl hydrolase family 28 protein [Marinilabiliales bacterium]|nr:glycosyl hydrolase family 28 protein [Marinilabiliales bacterium]
MKSTLRLGLLLCLCACLSNALFASLPTSFGQMPDGTFSAKAFGAVGDGLTKDTHAIQAAIDSCAAKGGGTVLLTPGIYLSGTLILRSGVALYLDHGATLRMSPDQADFDPYETLGFKTKGDKETSFFHYALIRAEDASHIAILGTGTIDGNRSKRGGPKPIAFKRCTDVTIEAITIRNSPNYCVSLLGTDLVRISGITILNGYCDGIDPDGCRNVRISDCNIDCFDDAIVPKASFSLGYLRSVENLVVTNCILASNCNAFKFGTETGGDFRNVTVSNCTILNRKTGKPADSGISLESVDGSHVENVTISNIAMQHVITPIFFRLGNRGRDQVKPTPGFVKNIRISNIVVSGASQAIIFAGIPGYPVENITLSDIRVGFTGGGHFEGDVTKVPELVEDYPDTDMFGPIPAWGFYCRHLKNIQLRNLDLTLEQPDSRACFHFEDAEDVYLETVTADRSAGPAKQFYLRAIREITLKNCSLPLAPLEWMNFKASEKKAIRVIPR